jgi:hypothetical protein
VRTKIKQCDFVIVVIGKYTHNCSGVLEEIRIANEENIPAFGIYTQSSQYYNPDMTTYIYVPRGLENRWFDWTWPNLTSAINSITSYNPPNLPR